MRFVKLAVMLGGLAALQIPQLLTASPFFEEPPELNFQVSGGYREDYLKFHIGGDKPHPKVFSKVKWKDLRIAEIGASVNYSTCHHYYMRASGDFGKIMQGDGRVSNQFTVNQHHKEEIDYHQNRNHHQKGHKQLSPDPIINNMDQHHGSEYHEISKQDADAGYGYVYDFSAGVGYKVVSGGGRAWIAGIVGYSFDRQDLKMRNFEQKKDSRGILNKDCIDKLKGSYKTSWIGPWIGIDFSTNVECDVTAFGTAEWHQINYRADGRWSLPQYSAKLRHHARGYGVVATLGFDWRPWDRWGFGVLGEYQQFSTRKGNNHAKVCNQLIHAGHLTSTFPVAEKSRLYRAKWISYSVSAVVSYRY